MNRREVMSTTVAAAAAVSLSSGQSASAAPAKQQGPQWISTQRNAIWRDLSDKLDYPDGFLANIFVRSDQPLQVIDGFGACFNELGWDALNLLPEADRESIFADFFSPHSSPSHGLGFTHCRMPLAANDFARDWYSFNDTPGDFEMKNFSIDRDRTSLIPYIKAAKQHQPDLHVWASPWSPPAWMKTNNHYAQRADAAVNDLAPEGTVREGEDAFIQEKKYFEAYALYFRKFIEAYREEGVNIEMVMPQNEFSSSQNFPSCVWTPEVLAEFVVYLEKEMGPLGVDIFLGTLERPDPDLFHRIAKNKNARKAIKGLGFQWAGRFAAPFLHYDYPELKIYQTEQECGDGRNDWRFARHGWSIMNDFMQAGCSVYEYWNMALVKGESSSWGWDQNSLVVIDREARTFEFTPDYYTLKHVCHFVQPGAQRLNTLTLTGHENALAFRNPDGRELLVIQNDQPEEIPVDIFMGGKIMRAALPANSLNTIVS